MEGSTKNKDYLLILIFLLKIMHFEMKKWW